MNRRLYYDSSRYFLYGVALIVPVVITFCDKVGFLTTVTGRSMRPTFNPESFKNNDRIWVSRWSLYQYQPKPGDIVAMFSPLDPKKRMVKRVIATEGEVICTQGYHLKTVYVPQGHCWVEGDNTRSSQDSNFYGPVSTGLICGRVSYIVWPPKRWGHVSQHLFIDQEERRSFTVDII